MIRGFGIAQVITSPTGGGISKFMIYEVSENKDKDKDSDYHFFINLKAKERTYDTLEEVKARVEEIYRTIPEEDRLGGA